MSFDPDSLDRRGPARKAALAGFAGWVIERVNEAAGGSTVDGMSAGPGGLTLRLSEREYRRNCHVGTQRWTLELPWEAFLSSRSMDDIRAGIAAREGERLLAEAERRREIEGSRRMAREAAEAEAAEARDLREWERLRGKFGGGGRSDG